MAASDEKTDKSKKSRGFFDAFWTCVLHDLSEDEEAETSAAKSKEASLPAKYGKKHQYRAFEEEAEAWEFLDSVTTESKDLTNSRHSSYSRRRRNDCDSVSSGRSKYTEETNLTDYTSDRNEDDYMGSRHGRYHDDESVVSSVTEEPVLSCFDPAGSQAETKVNYPKNYRSPEKIRMMKREEDRLRHKERKRRERERKRERERSRRKGSKVSRRTERSGSTKRRSSRKDRRPKERTINDMVSRSKRKQEKPLEIERLSDVSSLPSLLRNFKDDHTSNTQASTGSRRHVKSELNGEKHLTDSVRDSEAKLKVPQAEKKQTTTNASDNRNFKPFGRGRNEDKERRSRRWLEAFTVRRVNSHDGVVESHEDSNDNIAQGGWKELNEASKSKGKGNVVDNELIRPTDKKSCDAPSDESAGRASPLVGDDISIQPTEDRQDSVQEEPQSVEEPKPQTVTRISDLSNAANSKPMQTQDSDTKGKLQNYKDVASISSRGTDMNEKSARHPNQPVFTDPGEAERRDGSDESSRTKGDLELRNDDLIDLSQSRDDFSAQPSSAGLIRQNSETARETNTHLSESKRTTLSKKPFDESISLIDTVSTDGGKAKSIGNSWLYSSSSAGCE